ncbi:nuclear transport factor 2 family protein [Cryptosporangium sp. NPDC048952]|uniref:nuclear transport factor 2 family protein n=1 Tax=Cryptosporangium sp. NPDC048952 TaxID=3363961 RepID=UPI003713DF9C
MARFADVHAGVLATIAAHSQAQDDGRVEDMVALYRADAIVEIPGIATLTGADAIRAAFSQPAWQPDPAKPQRHIVSNTVLTKWDDHTAEATSDVVMLTFDGTAWAPAIVARYHDRFSESGGRWLLTGRVDEYVGFTP